MCAANSEQPSSTWAVEPVAALTEETAWRESVLCDQCPEPVGPIALIIIYKKPRTAPRHPLPQIESLGNTKPGVWCWMTFLSQSTEEGFVSFYDYWLTDRLSLSGPKKLLQSRGNTLNYNNWLDFSFSATLLFRIYSGLQRLGNQETG